MIERGRAQPRERSDERLPPGQHWTSGFPVLDLGIHPKVGSDEWRLELSGHLERSLALRWAEVASMPTSEFTADFHCVTTWSVKDCKWRGVPLGHLIDLVRPLDLVEHVLFTGYDDYTTNVRLHDVLEPDALLATHLNDQPLSLEHGAPARIILPRLYAWKGAKFVRRIEFLSEREGGYWEKRGYSDTADPWTEDRFTRPEPDA
jgi:DMSO/TMAO reductase YedYZ molybdopterin-dependent catalytic subunit